MALNPFFLKGSSSEQRLIQDLINEQLQIFGLDVTYIPRKFVQTDNIMNEVQSSKFDDNFTIEAYVNNFDGYAGSGDVLTKFGMSLKDEVTLTISKDRFEDFIAPFMGGLDDGSGEGEIILSSRPREGDLVYFPLGERLFEVKFVEHENPFYQLGKNYVYELQCELFEYEDEVIDTSIDIIDTQVQDEGFISSLQLVGYGRTATANANIETGYIRKIFLNNDGSGFTSPPTVAISTSPTGQVGDNATAVGILTTRANITSIKELLLTNAGAGYTVAPTITITGGGGIGAAATCSLETVQKGVFRFVMLDSGVGYSTVPTVSVVGAAVTAVGIASIGRAGSDMVVKSIYISDPGEGYTTAPAVTIANPPQLTGIGTYLYNEIVIGEKSRTEARVRNWDKDTKILKIAHVGIGSTAKGFATGEAIIGQESGASYTVDVFKKTDEDDKYNQGDEFELEADKILDFTQTNPFGVY